jgi:stage V sporulation protein G
MEITEVKISLKDVREGNQRLKAYATITFDNAFVVRNIKIIEGNKGLFIAMPSRKVKEACPKCNFKNVLGSRFCNYCSASLPPRPIGEQDKELRQSEHRDIAHPINKQTRDMLQDRILGAYNKEKDHSTIQPQ